MIDSAELLLENQQLREDNNKLQLQIRNLQHQIEQLLRSTYGSKSEKFIPSDPNQISLPLDIEAVQRAEKEKVRITYEREKQSGKSNHKGRLPLPDHLERREIIMEPLEDVTGMVKIGEEVSEQLEMDPGKLWVKRTVRPKYARPQGEGVVIADMPSSIIQRGMAGASLLAMIVIQKYVDHLPLYRQIEQFKRMGMEIPSSTMSDWVGLCIRELTPLYEALKAKLLSSNYLQADETKIQVLDKDKKGKTHRGYYWVYRDPISGLVLFDYQPGRGRDGPTEILKNFSGYLQSDGYSAYENFDKEKITLIHCMAHARRYFEQALNNDKQRAEFALTEILKLYALERYARTENLTYEQRADLRQREALPVLQGMNQWLKENLMQVTPSSAIGNALAYATARWDKLMIYATDGRLEIDNNLVENSIRPIAIGRKNYLFAGSHEFAQRAAMIYSLLGTCKLKEVEPFAWLKNVFEVLPDWKANRIEELLP